MNKHEVGEHEKSTKKCLLEHQKEEKESLSEERRRRLRKRFGIMDRRTFELDSDQMR